MATAKPKFYITTPIYYVNARPHLGHTYTTIAADAIARYKQMRGFDVLFLTGTDEHGQKVERSAKNNDESPIDFVDRVSGEYRDLWKELGPARRPLHSHHRNPPRPRRAAPLP